MTQSGRRWGRIVIALAILLVIVWGVVRLIHRTPSTHAAVAAPAPPDASAPDGVRIKVEVLNGTKTRGLARRATSLLRDRGFDVVGSGTNPQQRATTIVFDRSSHPDWAHRVGKAINAPVESRPDSSRYLDVTVILGADWRPPPLPFDP